MDRTTERGILVKARRICLQAAVLCLSVACSACRGSGGDVAAPAKPPADTAAPVAATVLRADGRTDSYRLIDSVLGGTAVETPDCAHPAFGPHITQAPDTVLKEEVFVFHLHVTPDNDRCINTDRQRVEIKTYDKSPDRLKAFRGDTLVLAWKFRIDENFQPSPDFTHIHQIKAADGDDAMPLITLTLRYAASGDRVEVIRVDSKGVRTVLTTAPLAPLLGAWIQADETTGFGTEGTYRLSLRNVATGTVVLSYAATGIDMWRAGTTFIRPKWGIYRSLHHPSYLRDEQIRFADFSIIKKEPE
jgi:hypothetical protein